VSSNANLLSLFIGLFLSDIVDFLQKDIQHDVPLDFQSSLFGHSILEEEFAQHESGPLRHGRGRDRETTEADRKEKNRIAAQRHRLARKERDSTIQFKLDQLDQRNAELKKTVEQTKAEVKKMRSLVIEMLKLRSAATVNL
jgi:predicted ribonuclease toxin of YeeF-YezG toxin-antitoxin module